MVHLRQIISQPHSGEGANTKLPNDAVLSIIEDIAEISGMEATRFISLDPFYWKRDAFETIALAVRHLWRSRVGRF